MRELISTIPSGWSYRARNRERDLPFGGKHSIFVPMTGAPYLRDLDDVRRWPTIADLNMFHKLAHMSPALHSSAHHIVEPMDLKVSHRHLHITYSSMKYSDKTFIGMTTSGKNAEDVHLRDPVRCRRDGGNPDRHRQLQRQFAARLERDDACGHAVLREAKPAGAVLALRAGRGKHARIQGADAAGVVADAGKGGTGQSITEIAMAWCFRSTSYFSKMFRRRFGHSPGAHRPMYFSAAVAPALAERFSLSDSPVREG